MSDTALSDLEFAEILIVLVFRRAEAGIYQNLGLDLLERDWVK